MGAESGRQAATGVQPRPADLPSDEFPTRSANRAETLRRLCAAAYRISRRKHVGVTTTSGSFYIFRASMAGGGPWFSNTSGNYTTARDVCMRKALADNKGRIRAKPDLISAPRRLPLSQGDNIKCCPISAFSAATWQPSTKLAQSEHDTLGNTASLVLGARHWLRYRECRWHSISCLVG